MKTENNEDETDESRRSQLKFEYDVHLLNYTIKIKKPKLGFLTSSSTMAERPRELDQRFQMGGGAI